MGDSCRHGRVGPCIQCSPWCPRDVSPEWVAEYQPMYEENARAGAEKARRIAVLVDLLNGIPVVCPTCGQDTDERQGLITKEQFLELLEKT